VTKKISNADLLWIFRERMASFDGRFKAAPIAILPSENGWEAVTAHRYRNAEPQVAKNCSGLIWIVFTLELSAVRRRFIIENSSNPAVRTRKATRLCHGPSPFQPDPVT